MTWYDALILGIVQGLTEFLPVSSSGHLEIGHVVLHTSGEENLAFAVLVHAATVLSTIVVLWYEIMRLIKGTFATMSWNEEKSYVAKILVSMIPVFVVGMFFKDQVESFFGKGLLVVGICLLVTACLLALSEWLQKRRLSSGHEVTYKDAAIIGVAQAVAVLPGLSRSGTTIATGLLCGVKKEKVAQFSFLMVLIPIMGEALLDMMKILNGTEAVTIGWLPAVAGFIAAFATGCFACRFMIEIVRRQRLMWFALYCLLIGSGAIVYTLCC